MILVTGGTGFLGAYIIRALVLDGFAVRALRRNNSSLPAFIEADIFEKVEWVEGDILDVVSLDDALKNAEVVIHSAGKVSFHPADRHELFHVNVEGTANVVNLALEQGVKRFIHISSVAALARTLQGQEVDENRKWEDNKANTHYARSKYLGELEVWRGMGEGLEAVILNPSTILGYGDWHSSSAALFKHGFEEFPWYTEGVNGFVDVEDVARLTVLLAKSELSGERYIVNGENWPFKQLQDTIAENFGKRKPGRKSTGLMLQIAWRLEKIKSLFSGKKPLLTRETAKVAQSKTRFNNGKIRSAFPQFEFTPLADTIKKACQRYMQAAGREKGNR